MTLVVSFAIHAEVARAQAEPPAPLDCSSLRHDEPAAEGGRIEGDRVSVAVYDYANAATEIPFAERLAGDIYRKIGVVIEWRNGCETGNRTALYINVVDDAMANRMTVIPRYAVGFAGAGTRGAYAIFGRTNRMAITHRMTPAYLLGFVFAHELAHLLLPPGTHGRFGLMSPNIALDSARMKKLDFSASERRLILQRLRSSELMATR